MMHFNRHNLIVLVFIIFSVFLTSCVYDTGNGYHFGLPTYEQRDIAVSEVDYKILLRADELLDNESHWSKESRRECTPSEKRTLFCALYEASLKVKGVYDHRQPALQEVRFVIDDYYKDRWDKHRLADFNSHDQTTFKDIKKIMAIAIKRIHHREE